MAASTLEPDIKDQKISYEVIREEDVEQVLKLLKKTFFKVNIFLFSVILGVCFVSFPFLNLIFSFFIRTQNPEMLGEGEGEFFPSTQ